MEKTIHPEPSELLLSLNSICEHISRNIYYPPETLLNYVLKKLVILMKAKAGNIRFYDKPSKKLILKASYGVSKKYRTAKPAIDTGTSVAGYVFEKGRAYAVTDLKKNNLYRFPEYALKEGIASLLSVPLATREKKLGVLSIYFAAPRQFTQQEIDFFSVLGKFLSTFLTAHMLEFQLRKSYLGIAKALIVTLEEKDLYAKGHSERVREIAMKIAKRLKLPRNTVQVLSDFGVLHDIGKVVINGSILNKPAKLSEEEWTVIKQHPVIGAKMISPVDGLTLSIPFVKYHHERIDGTGYPNGLSGGSIPLLAKIIAVADAFDAMTTKRAYRNALTIEQAKTELIKNAGTQFDEEIVRIIIELIESGEIK